MGHSLTQSVIVNMEIDCKDLEDISLDSFDAGNDEEEDLYHKPTPAIPRGMCGLPLRCCLWTLEPIVTVGYFFMFLGSLRGDAHTDPKQIQKIGDINGPGTPARLMYSLQLLFDLVKHIGTMYMITEAGKTRTVVNIVSILWTLNFLEDYYGIRWTQDKDSIFFVPDKTNNVPNVGRVPLRFVWTVISYSIWMFVVVLKWRSYVIKEQEVIENNQKWEAKMKNHQQRM